ncbi:MAG: hypothetical protein FWF23_03480 [Alphaproteobacteria bacterium]|nr:hypothetical protein [Alphaproteobacteria bacterium]MCL2505451.1 hypothetical protein [Alphaproteobacteria bacterium]
MAESEMTIEEYMRCAKEFLTDTNLTEPQKLKAETVILSRMRQQELTREGLEFGTSQPLITRDI